MSNTSLKSLILSDYNRYANWREAVWSVSFHVTFWFRICTWLYQKNRFTRIISSPFRQLYKLLNLLSGIQLGIGTKVGMGLRFFHYSCIVIARAAKIGNNCSIHQGVTIGRIFNGPKRGVPTIGDNVVIFAGAKILGGYISLIM